MIGSGTALADDPLLTVRLAGLAEQAQPVRIVVDGRLRLSLTSRLARTAKDIRTIVVVLPHADKARVEAFQSCGVEIMPVHADASGRPNLVEMMKQLGVMGLTRILCEGGSNLAASLLQADLADRLAWFRSPGIIGGDGLRAIQPLGLTLLAQQHRFERVGVVRCGDDLLERLSRIR
jgi:diaminohydroxyphosphoribosylaminopyrimidine deaminase/5-amino-6-(5-phosphoribosylamino)uracil reductase